MARSVVAGIGGMASTSSTVGTVGSLPIDQQGRGEPGGRPGRVQQELVKRERVVSEVATLAEVSVAAAPEPRRAGEEEDRRQQRFDHGPGLDHRRFQASGQRLGVGSVMASA